MGNYRVIHHSYSIIKLPVTNPKNIPKRISINTLYSLKCHVKTPVTNQTKSGATKLPKNIMTPYAPAKRKQTFSHIFNLNRHDNVCLLFFNSPLDLIVIIIATLRLNMIFEKITGNFLNYVTTSIYTLIFWQIKLNLFS